MKKSIRKFLLIYLLLTTIVMTAMVAIGNYYCSQKNIKKHLQPIIVQQLGQKIIFDNLIIILLTLPLYGGVVWLIIGRSFNRVQIIAKEVANREPNHLTPVQLKEIPEEIKPVIEELNKLLYRLKNGLEREQRFAADAAHELRTPLAAIKAQAQVALNANNIAEKDIALQKLLISVKRSTHVIQQLLTMSTIPKTKNANDFAVVNLNLVVRDILALLAPTAIDNHIDIEFKCDQEIPNILGNATAIGILVRNLVDNAILYCKQETVTVSLYPQKNTVVLEVSDTGPGIPRALHARVFERFYRVLGNKTPGSGLGLAIVRQICTLHNARIKLTAPKKGTGLIVRIFFHKI